MPNLTVSDSNKNFIHQIDGELLSIGRAPTNTIEISDAKASKEHCRVERVGNRWKVVDLESKNGTRVNGNYCNKAWLEHGDTIQIGRAELRFGVEGAGRQVQRSRTPARSPSRPAPTRRQPPPPDDDEYYEDELPARRRYGKSTNDKMVIGGLVLLGAVLIFVIASKMASSLQRDAYNLALLKQADVMMQNDEWDEALAHLQKHVRDGSSRGQVEKRMREIQARKGDFKEDREEQAAKILLSKVSRKIKAYNQGKTRSLPEDILKMVGELKQKYPGTESTKLAKNRYRAWFAGRVPQRASDLMRSSPQLRKDWDAAVARSYEYEKQWKFREARETIEIFLTAREAVLDQSEIDRYGAKVAEALRRIDLSADSIYNGVKRRAWTLEKNKRYDQAIKKYQEIIDTFGIDIYQRKAQEEINKLKAKKG